MLSAQRGEGEETEAPQTVVEGDQDDTLPGELDPRSARRGAAAEHESAAVDPHHDWQLRPRRGPGRPPHIDKQAILRRRRRDPRRAAGKACLRTIRTERGRITLSLPRGKGLRRAPTIGADRCSGIGNPLEAGNISFGHAAHDSGGGTNRRRRGRNDTCNRVHRGGRVRIPHRIVVTAAGRRRPRCQMMCIVVRPGGRDSAGDCDAHDGQGRVSVQHARYSPSSRNYELSEGVEKVRGSG